MLVFRESFRTYEMNDSLLNLFKMIINPFQVNVLFIPDLNHSWWRSLPYRNQSIDFLCKLIDWFLYDKDLRHERVRTSENLWLFDVFREYKNETLNWIDFKGTIFKVWPFFNKIRTTFLQMISRTAFWKFIGKHWWRNPF